MDDVKVAPPGTICSIRIPGVSPLEGIPGRIDAVAIYEQGKIEYRVIWWDGRTRTSNWLSPDEVMIGCSSDGRMQIGFQCTTG